MDMNLFILECADTAKQKGWDDKPRTFGEDVALIHAELSEALEEYREKGYKNWTNATDHGDKPEGVLSEFADVFIRIGHIIGREGLIAEFLAEIKKKMEFNKRRPYRHGDKRL